MSGSNSACQRPGEAMERDQKLVMPKIPIMNAPTKFEVNPN